METTRFSIPRKIKKMDIYDLFKAFNTLRHTGINLTKIKDCSSLDTPGQYKESLQTNIESGMKGIWLALQSILTETLIGTRVLC